MSIISSIQNFGQTVMGSAGKNDPMKMGAQMPMGQINELKNEVGKYMKTGEIGKSFDLGGIRETLTSPGLRESPEMRSPVRTGSAEFPRILENMVKEVDMAQKAAVAQSNDVMLGRSDNIHQSVIAMNEASVAFSLMVEVRNKLVEAYQELMRMQV